MAGIALCARKMATALWLAAVVAALVSPFPVSSEDNGGFRCPERSNCSCLTSGVGYYEMVCPMTGPSSFIVKFITGKYVQLQCQENVRPEDYSMLPSLVIPDSEDSAESFSFNSCPLPTTPLADIVSKLGINKLRALMFQTYGKNLSNTLKRQHFKGLEGITRLVLSGNGLTDLPENLFIDMKNLTWLNLRSNKLHLPPDLFKHIPKLNLLELGHNDLGEIPHGLFKHLTVLKQLNLWQNSLTNLTAEVFDGLDSLEELDLSSNKIQSLPSDVFSKLPNLKLLNLYSNNLSSLPEELFEHNPKMVMLKLYDNRHLQTLPEGFLSNKTNLTDLKLERCKMTYLPESLLWGSGGIKNINLKGNSLTEIGSSLLRDQENLTELYLSDNAITKIHDEAFQSLKLLKILDLDKNRLVELSGKIFARLISLEKLTIRENRLQEVSFDTFFSTRALEMVDMAYNNLSFMEDYGMAMRYAETYGLRSPFQKLEKMKTLNLSHNSITEIFSDWRQSMPNLRSLDLSFNKMQKLMFADVNIVNNNILLDLRNNNISEIEFNQASLIAENQDPQQPDAYHGASTPAHIVRVLVEQNPLHCDCILYNFVLYLEGKLDPQVRSLVSVEPGSASCASPSDLAGRKLVGLRAQELVCPLDVPQSQKPALCPKNCTCNVRPYDVSLIVNCSTSSTMGVPSIPDARALTLSQTELHFENNMMTSLSPLSANQKVYNQITRLFVGGNNISTLTAEDIPNHIEILDLRNNNLKQINDSVSQILKNSTTLKQLWISGNSIACDCDNQPFLAFLQSNFKKVRDFTNVTCAEGQKVDTISLGDLCGTTPAVIALSVVFALAGLFLGIMAALYYKYQDEIKIWLFARNLCLWCITEKELDKDKLYDAFISFSHKDEDFVANKLVPELEGGSNPFKICLHFRDWVAGEWIPTQIARSVEDSRRTLVVLSPNFLESVWGRMEFRAAHSRALKEGRARVILILYGDIGPTDNLDPELQAYLSMNTYIKWGDPWFWDKLRYALPHPQMNKIHAPAHNVMKKNGFDDRLELIHPTTPTTPPGQNTPPAHQAHTNPLMNHVNSLPNGINGMNGINGINNMNGINGTHKSPNIMNGTITMNGLKVNGNAKHSDV